MKRDVFCKLCKNNIGKAHGYQSGKFLRNHIFEHHKVDWGKLVMIARMVDALHESIKEFGVHETDLFLYKYNEPR